VAVETIVESTERVTVTKEARGSASERSAKWTGPVVQTLAAGPDAASPPPSWASPPP